MSDTAALFLTGADTLNRFSQQRSQANAIVARGSYEGAAADRNAKLAEMQAADAIQRGESSANIRALEGRQEMGATRASLAAQGLDLGFGSAVDVQVDEAKLSALDVATIRNNAAREAWGYTVQAQDYTQAGKFARTAAQNEATALRGASVSTLLTGAGKTYGLFRAARGGTYEPSTGLTPDMVESFKRASPGRRK